MEAVRRLASLARAAREERGLRVRQPLARMQVAVPPAARGAALDEQRERCQYRSDRIAIEQIFSNLIDNALKYLKSNVPGDIAIRGRRKLGFAIFEITDNGRGIDPKDHQRIFDLFRRAGPQDRPGQGRGVPGDLRARGRGGRVVPVRAVRARRDRPPGAG